MQSGKSKAVRAERTWDLIASVDFSDLLLGCPTYSAKVVLGAIGVPHFVQNRALTEEVEDDDAGTADPAVSILFCSVSRYANSSIHRTTA